MRGKQNKTDVWDWKREGVAEENRATHTYRNDGTVSASSICLSDLSPNTLEYSLSYISLLQL